MIPTNRLFFSSLKVSFLMGSMLISFLAVSFLTSCNEGRTKRSGPREGSGRTGGSDREICPEAGLSEEQKTTIRELRESSRKSTRNLSQEERHTQREQLHQAILAVAETDEQKAALSECLSRPGRRRTE